MLNLNQRALHPADWAPVASGRIRIVEAAVLLGVMGHFAGLLAALILF